MAVTYTQVAFYKIEEKLKNILNGEFHNVYISDKYRPAPNEAIRIDLERSDQIFLSTGYEVREYEVHIWHYFENQVREKHTEQRRNRVDRLKELLYDNKSVSGYWHEMSIDIDYRADDETIEDNTDISVSELTVLLKSGLIL